MTAVDTGCCATASTNACSLSLKTSEYPVIPPPLEEFSVHTHVRHMPSRVRETSTTTLIRRTAATNSRVVPAHAFESVISGDISGTRGHRRHCQLELKLSRKMFSGRLQALLHCSTASVTAVLDPRVLSSPLETLMVLGVQLIANTCCSIVAQVRERSWGTDRFTWT